jgi:hypothetical protein
LQTRSLRSGTEAGNLLAGFHKASLIGLLCAQVDALLLLRRLESLTIALVQQARHGLAGSETLLPSKVRLCNPTTVATKSATRDLIAEFA